MNYTFTHIDNDQLLQDLSDLVIKERHATACVLAHISEVDARKLYLDQACSSMFVYCVERLRLSEGAAYRRITAARAGRRFPIIFEKLGHNQLHLTSITLVSSHLTAENHRDLLDEVGCKSKKEIEKILARRFPKPDVVPTLRALPQRLPEQPLPTEPRSPAENPCATATQQRASSVPTRSAEVLEPLSPRRFKLQVTLDQSACEKLEQAQALLRHRYPRGEFEHILNAALDALLEKTQKERFALGQRSRRQGVAREGSGRCGPDSRHIPNRIKREVLTRDGERCTFRDRRGQRCKETGMLELHHIKPFARGGPSTTDNITVYCRAHNQHAAERDFGPQQLSLG